MQTPSPAAAQSPGAGSASIGSVEQILITGELASRPRRQPDLQCEAAASRELAALILASPARAIQRFLDIAMELCKAGTAGLSLLRGTGSEQHFHWEAVSGALADRVGGTAPRDFSPCGLCLDAGRTILLRRPFERFDYFRDAAQPLMEGLIVPLYDTGGRPIGTIWVVHHDPARHFDAEDARVMEQLAVQLVLALKLRSERSNARTLRRNLRALQEENAGLIDESAFLQGILDSSSDCIKVLDTRARLVFMSEGGREAMELDERDDLRGRYWPDFWTGKERELAIAAVKEAVEGNVGRFQGQADTAKGTAKFWDVRVTPIRAADGVPKHLLAIARDITEEHHAEEDRNLLGRELEHRVKNSLSTVVAIINQTFRASTSLSEAHPILIGRVTALAHAHDILTRTSWNSASIKAVVEAALAPHGGGTGRFQVSGPDVTLSARRALSLSLALHELATNAAKYGALSDAKGRVELSWSVENGNGAGFRLTWQERGGPPVSQPQRRGFGSVLLERVLPADFAAEVRIDYPPSGVVFELTASVDSLAQAG